MAKTREQKKDTVTLGAEERYSDSGPLMTSLEFLGQALPEAKGVSASHSQ